MENKNMLWQNSMNYGAILGGILVVLSLVGYVFNMQNATILQMLNYFALGMLLYYGSKVLRDKYQDGYITYGRALASGFLISLFAGIIVSFFVLVYLKWIDPATMESIKMQSQKIMVENGYPEKQIEMSLKYLSPNIFAIGTIFSFAFWGFVLSLIAAMLLKRDTNPMDVIPDEKMEDVEAGNDFTAEVPENTDDNKE